MNADDDEDKDEDEDEAASSVVSPSDEQTLIMPILDRARAKATVEVAITNKRLKRMWLIIDATCFVLFCFVLFGERV